MKKFNIFSKSWSLLVSSQSSDISLDRRFTVGSPSGCIGNTMLRLISVLAILLTIGIGQMWGALSSPSTCEFDTRNTTILFDADNTDVIWVASSASTSFDNSDDKRGAQWGGSILNGTGGLTLTCGVYNVYTITQIEVVWSRNDIKGATVSAKVGGSTFGSSDTNAAKTTNRTATFTGSASGTITINATSTSSSNSFWIKSIKVTYTTGSGGANSYTDVLFAKCFTGYNTNSFSSAGTDYATIANSTNATGTTYAMQIINGNNGQIKGSSSGAANFSCRNTSTYSDYYISQVSLTVSSGTLDGSSSGRSIVYFGSSAYSNPNTSAPTGDYTSASPSSSGQSTLTWSNSDESVSYFLLYNLKTANSAYSADASHALQVTWTKKSDCSSTPTVGAASLNGSFTLSSVGVQCASASAGDGCSLSEYGFVWGTSNTGTHPDATDNKVTNAGAYAANYTNSLSSTFSTGVTYYYRGYAKNNGDIYGYSSEVKSFTPYKVYYNKNNGSAEGSITDQIVNTGGSVTLSDGTGFTLAHYHIDHWAKGSAEGTSYNKGATYSSITADAEFYAIWAINSWAFAWDFDGGSSSETAGTNYTAAATLDYGTSITKPSNASMSKTGYTFNGWNSSATSMPDEALTIKALWTANKYDITYKDKGNVAYSGSNSGSLPAKHTYGSATALVNGAKTGYTFGGWYTDTDCTESAGSSIGATAITDAITLYAKWTANTYKVSFNKNGGSGDAMSDQNFTYDVAQSLSTNTYTPPTDKYFIGWNTDKDATTALYEDEESVSNLTSTANGTVTLYAIWKDHTYTNYRTTCCDNKVALSHNSPSNGTVVFSKSKALTCDDDVDVTMTITPSAGYYLSDWSKSGTVNPSSTSADVSYGDVDDDDAQAITLTFAQNSSGTYTSNATFTAKPLEGWSWKYKKGADVADGSVDPYAVPLVVESYIGEYVRFVIDGYSPTDVIAEKQGYVYEASGVQPAYSTDDLAWVANTTSYFTLRGKAATESTTIVFKSAGNADVTQSFRLKINALPTVTFVDLIHNKVDFTNSGSGYTAATGVLTSTVTTGVVSHSGKTPAHSDIDVPGSGNDCELSHLHLVGWIRSDYSKVANYLNGTGSAPTDSEITSAGTDDGGLNYYFTPDASIDIEDYNGFTFYAVWSEIK